MFVLFDNPYANGMRPGVHGNGSANLNKANIFVGGRSMDLLRCSVIKRSALVHIVPVSHSKAIILHGLSFIFKVAFHETDRL